MRNQSGITITALVVAIIVMVILLTVTITVAIKDGGIFDTTKESMHKTQNEMDYEQNTLGNHVQGFVENPINGLYHSKISKKY